MTNNTIEEQSSSMHRRTFGSSCVAIDLQGKELKIANKMALDFVQNTEYFGDSRRLCERRIMDSPTLTKDEVFCSTKEFSILWMHQ